ncbi:MAG TPA: hypothetical protein V6D35_04320 [Candidatus Sericytochromatia bacterium]
MELAKIIDLFKSSGATSKVEIAIASSKSLSFELQYFSVHGLRNAIAFPQN